MTATDIKNAVPPSVSVILPVYNAERFLGLTLQSLAAQTCKNFEALLIIDAKCNEETRTIAFLFCQSHENFRLVSGPAVGGVSANRNVGIDEAQGKYLAFLDADDLWLPEKLSTQVQFMQRTLAKFSHHSYQWISEDGKLLPVQRHADRDLKAKDLLTLNRIGCLTAMVEKSAIGDVRFRQVHNEDWIFWHELLGGGVICKPLPQILAQYRIVRGSRSANKWKVALSKWQLFRREFKLDPLSSAYYFLAYLINSLWLRR